MEALRRNPDLRNAHSELNAAMHGMIPDWNARNHYLQINFYREHIRNNPKDWRAYMWMMDQLVDDYRLDEAEAYLADFAQIDSSYRVLLYRGIIAWQKGNRDQAFAFWADMERKFPEEWCVWHNIGDFKARCGQYDDALAYYRKALDVQSEPPMLDPLQAITQLCEIRGDIPGAIAAKREEADRIENQWHIRGEELDCVLREVARLEKLMK